MKKELSNIKYSHKIIALLLCAILMLEATPLLAFAENITKSFANSNEPSVSTVAESTSNVNSDIPSTPENEQALGKGELSQAQLSKLKPEDVQRPETVTLEKAIQSGHVHRLTAQEEDLRVVMFQNQDASKTTYVYDKPVKYVDNRGTVRDKSTAISKATKSDYAYEMTQNSFQAYFGKSSSVGVKINYKNYFFSMIPKTSLTISSPTISQDTKSIIYSEAFGKNTALRYQTQISGIKEDIVLMSDIGKSTFEFLLRTNASPCLTKTSDWALLDDEGKKIADFGQILVNDSSGKAIYGTMNIVPLIGEEYVITITVPDVFLKSRDTTYPVYIDPTIIVNETDVFNSYEGSEMIETEYATIYDIGLYNNSTTYNAALADEDRHILSEGSGEIVYRFYDFIDENGKFYNLNPYQIGSVTMHFTSALQSRATYTVYPMTSLVSNAFLAVNNPTLFNAYSQKNSTSAEIVATYGDTFSLDITDIARGWASFNMNQTNDAWNNPANGFVLVQTDSLLGENWIYSTEADGNTNVYYEIVTSNIGGLYAIRNQDSGRYMERQKGKRNTVDFASSVATASDSPVHEGAYWIIDYRLNGKYTISLFSVSNYALSAAELAEPFYETDYSFEDQYNNKLYRLTKNATNDFYWEISYAANSGAIIRNCNTGKVLTYGAYNNTHFPAITNERSPTSEDYSKTVWFLTKLNDRTIGMESFERAEQDDTSWINLGASYTPVLVIESASTTFHTYQDFYWTSENSAVASVNENGTILGLANGYTNIIVESKGSGDKIILPIVVGQLIPNGTYRLRKAGEQLYASATSNLSNPVYLAERSSPAALQTWKFTYVSGGYYRIQWMSGAPLGAKLTANGIIAMLNTSPQITTQWRLEVTQKGNYRFVNRQYESYNYVLAKSTEQADTGLYVRSVTPSSSTLRIAEDEWVVERNHQVSMIAIPDPYDENSEVFFESVEATFSQMGYTDIFAGQRCMNDEFLKSYMSNSKVVMIRTHGSSQSIGTSNQQITIGALSNLNLGGVDLIVYAACSTGEIPEGSSTRSFAQATVEAGATTVVGFSDTVYLSEINNWCIEFFDYLCQGYTVSAAATEACTSIEQDHITPEILVICGEGDLTLPVS